MEANVIRDRLKRAAKRLLNRKGDVPGKRPAPSPRQRPATSTPEPRSLELDLDTDEIDLDVDSALVDDWLSEDRKLLFVDVRELSEMAAGHVEDAHLIPMGQIPDRHSELPKDRSLVVYCAAGGRSHQVAHFLRDQGFDDAWSMVGGMGSWLAHGGQQVIPPSSHLGPGQGARLTQAGRDRLGAEATQSTVQEVRQTDEGVRYVLGFGEDRLEGLTAEDLEPTP
jgi:rhodanese-related sulfurtransferase